MIIAVPEATLGWVSPDPERYIELVGRTAYRSEDRITENSYAPFIDMLFDREHYGVLEHACASLRFICDRGVSHEMVRHRIASFLQESTRYCDYSKEKHKAQITVVQPPALDEQALGLWRWAMEMAQYAYLGMRHLGVKPEIARSVLPTCLKTEIVVTTNFREWLHILELRTAPAAHPQIREVMLQAEALLRKNAPVVFAKRDNRRKRIT